MRWMCNAKYCKLAQPHFDNIFLKGDLKGEI